MEITQTTCENAISRQKQTRVTEQARGSSGAVIGRRSTAGREAELVRSALQKEPRLAEPMYVMSVVTLRI